MTRKAAPESFSFREFARAIDSTANYVGQLVRNGVVPVHGTGNNRGIPAIDGVAAYVRFVRGDKRNKTKDASQNRARDARATEIELRIATAERELIPLDEAIDIISVFLGSLRTSIDSIPAQISRDPEIRAKAKKVTDDILSKMADLAQERRSALRSGSGVAEADQPDDAEPMGEQ